MWQRFTERARKVVFYAQEEAQRYGEGYVSTEHLLLGMMREECNGTTMLDRMGLDRKKVVHEVESHLSKGKSIPNTDMSLTPRSKRVIDLSYDEARNFGHNYIGTEHLLLGIIREADGLAGRVLAKLGADIDSARRVLMVILEEQPERQYPTRTSDTVYKQPGPKPSVRIAYTEPILSREASFVNLLFGIGPLRFTDELLFALCLSDPFVRLAFMKQSIDADLVRATMQAVLADPDQNRIQDPCSLSTILDLAEKERANLGDAELSAIHIVIAIMTLDTSLAALALSEAGVNLQALRERKPPEA